MANAQASSACIKPATLFTRSFRIRRPRCISTVRGLSCSACAASLLVIPLTSSAAIWRSRGESASFRADCGVVS